MNEHDPFEQRLRRQPLRPVPSSWREEILAQARVTAEVGRADRHIAGRVICGTPGADLAKRFGVRQPSAALAPASEKRQRAVALQNAGAPTEALLAGWRLLFARLPLAWASLAALWIALIGVNLMMPCPMVRLADPAPPSAQMEALVALDSPSAEFESLNNPPAPPSQTVPGTRRPEVPVRPRSERRRDTDRDAICSDSLSALIA